LSGKIKQNFKLLSSCFEKGSTILSIEIIKAISKIYNKSINNEECINLIESLGYTNEFSREDSAKRMIEKFFADVFYGNRTSKQIDYIANYLIHKYNKEMENDEIFFKYLNEYRKTINKAIISLKEFKD